MSLCSSFHQFLHRIIPHHASSPRKASLTKHDTSNLHFIDLPHKELFSHPNTLKDRLIQPNLSSFPKPHATYDGGFKEARLRGVCLRIANGGAGQSGLIQAWADAFIQYMVKRGVKPFEIAWYLGDTTQNLAMLASGTVDIAVTYNPAAENQLLDSGDATQRVYGFRDHFMLVGPRSNPASLEDKDDILRMFSKIVSCGNADVAVPPNPELRPPTRFLTRFDKSATNIKESQIFLTIGQAPWALNYSKWYHQYSQFPFEALKGAALLSEYTLIDLGSWLCAPKSVTSMLRVFKLGTDDPHDILLNPAHVLLGRRVSPSNERLCKDFMSWVVSTGADGGQRVVEGFSKNGKILYTKAPVPQIVP